MRSCLGLGLLLLLIVAVLVTVVYHVSSNSEIEFSIDHRDDSTFITTKTPIEEARKAVEVKIATNSVEEIPMAQPVEEDVPVATPVDDALLPSPVFVDEKNPKVKP